MDAAANETPARTRRLVRAGTGTALAALLLAAAAGLWLALEEPWRPRVRLPDGSRLAVLGISHGSQHQTPEPRRWWERLLDRRPFPGGLFASHATGSGTLVVWTRRDRSPGGSFVLYAVDEHGCRFPGLPVMGSADVVPWTRSVEAWGWEFPVFPRRETFMRIRAADASRRAWSPPLTVPNPAPGSYPDWAGSALPVTVREGDLEWVFRGFRPASRSGEAVTPVMEFRQAGKPLSGWGLRGFRLTDATGNRQGGVPHPDFAMQVRPLCALERAWRVEAELAPRGPNPVPPKAVWTTPALPLPRGGRQAFPHRPEDLGRHGMTILTLGRAARPGTPVEILTASPFARGARSQIEPVLLRAADERGRPAPVARPMRQALPASAGANWARRMGSSTRLQVHEVRPAPDARTLRLTFGLYRTYAVDVKFRPR